VFQTLKIKTNHIWIGAILVIVFLGIIVYFLFFNPSPSIPTPTNNTITTSYPPVFLTVVSDFSSALLNQSLIDKNLSSLIPNLTISYIDFNSTEGQALQSNVNASFLPFYVFNSSVLNSPAFPTLLKVLTAKLNGSYLLTSFETHQGFLINNVEQPFALRLFVTSYDYHGWIAENETYKFLSNFSQPVNFSLNFIVGLNGSSFVSLNGPNELEEDARQVCLSQQNSTDLKFYLNCLNTNLLSDFNTSNLSIGGMFYRAALSSQSCAAGVGAYNASLVNSCSLTCSNNTVNATVPNCTINTSILRNEFQQNQQFNVIATPTYVFNNKYVYVGVLSSQQIQSIMCKLNAC
jgi:hypothetical protein